MPFDQQAAVELAVMTRDAPETGDWRAGSHATRATPKFDRQIIAIGRTQNQTTFYSDDSDIAKLAKPLSLNVIPVHELPRPPEDSQHPISFEPGDGD